MKTQHTPGPWTIGDKGESTPHTSHINRFMKSFTLPSGTTYGTGFDGKQVCTGSQMGRSNVLPADRATPCKLRLVRLPFVDGDYDRWGAYWGGPANVYCAAGDCGEIVAEVYVRADSRVEAKARVREFLPNARFAN